MLFKKINNNNKKDYGMDILFVTVTDYRTMTIEGYGAAFVGSALLLTSVCLTDYHNLKRM